MKTFFFLTVLFVSYSFPSSGEVFSPQLLSKKGPLSIHLQSEYFNTVSNYRLLGEYVDLPGKNFFNYVANNFSLNYSPIHWFNIETFFNTMWSASATDTELRNKFGITYAGLGFTFLKKINNFQINFELKGGAPLHSIPENTDEIVLGDGAYFINPNLWFIYEYPSKLFYLFYNINLLYRTKYLSSLLFNKLGFVFQTPFANAGFSTELFLPVMRDGYTHVPNTRWDITNKVNGGSYKFYSINPASLSFTGWMEWKLNPLSLNVYANVDTYGQNYAKGITLGFITSFKWDTKTKKRSHAEKFFKRKRSTSKKNSYFEEEEDSQAINQELMEELHHLR